MKKHLLFNQLFGTEGNPNQTGETLTPSDERAMTERKPRGEKEQLSSTCLRSASVLTPFRSRYLRYAAMIFAVLMLSMANIGTAWGTDVHYILVSQGYAPLTKGTLDGSYNVLKTDGTTIGKVTSVSSSITTAASLYYNSTSSTYTNLTNTSNYGTSSSSSTNTLKGINIGKGNTATIDLGSQTFTKIDVIYRCNSTSAGTLTIAGEDVATSSTSVGLKTKTGSFSSSFTIKATSQDYRVVVILTREYSPSYTVTYDANGGSGVAPSDANTYESDDPVTVLGKNTLSKSGYIFAGWNTADNGSGTPYSPGETMNTGAGNVTLYAQWDTEVDLKYVWKTGNNFCDDNSTSTTTVNMISENDYFTLTGTGVSQESGSSLNIGKKVDNKFLITAKSGYQISSICFYGKIESTNVNKTTDNSDWSGTIASTGTSSDKRYTFDDINSTYFGVKLNTADKGIYIRNMVITMTVAPAPSGYKLSVFNSSTNGEYNFVAGTGENEIVINDFVIPEYTAGGNSKQFWVGPGSYTGHATNEYFSWKRAYHQQNNSCTSNLTLGSPVNAIGTLHAWTNSDQDNYGLCFEPNGYGIKWGVDGSPWTNVPFESTGEPTVWLTDIVSLTSDMISNYKYYVGLLTNDGDYVGSFREEGDARGLSNTDNISGMRRKTASGDNWANGLVAGHGKFRIWVDNCTQNFYCHFVPHYKLTYNANGGSGAPEAAYVSVEATPCEWTLSNTQPTKENYVFLGWSTNSSATEPDAASEIADLGTPYPASGDVTLYAVWQACSGPNGGSATYTAAGYTYDLNATANTMSLTGVTASNGGALSYQWYKTTSDVAHGEAISGATSNTYRPATDVAHAANWYYFCRVTEAGCSTTYTSGLSGAIVVNEAATLYTVTYNVNGGGSVTPTSATQASSGAAVILPTPTWSGYTFEGWYNAGTKITGASYTPTDDIILYAHWTDNISGKVFSFIDNNYGDKFKGLDGSTWVSSDQTGKDKTYTNGTTGVQFVVDDGAWDNKNNAISSLAKFKGGTTKMKVVIPTGKIATVKISYNAYGTGDDYRLTVNSTAQANPSTKLTDGMTNAQVIASMKEITLNSQTGTLTLGISNTGKNNYIGRVSAVITGYTVSYDKGSADGASGSLASGTKTAGSSFTLSSSSSAFTRSGYTYDGWSVNENGSTKDYNLGGSYTTDAPVTLYPHWVADASATITATLLTPAYMRTGASGVQIGVEITGASTGWYYRVKKGGGYETPDNTTYTTTTWTMTSTIGAEANTYTVELYNGSGTKMAESNAVTVTGETGHPMTIAAGEGGSASPASTWANGDHLHPEITATPSSGYHFVNWDLSNSNATLANASSATTTITNASGACTITANFAADATLYTVTFNSNGGSSVDAIEQASAGASITMPAAPTYASHTFQGWVIGGTTYTAGASYTPTANITAYASWKETCAGGGGSGATLFTQNFNSATEVAYEDRAGSKLSITTSSGNNIVGNTAASQFTSITADKKGSTGIAINSASGGNSQSASGIFQAYYNNTGGYWSICKTSDFAATAPTAIKVGMKVWARVGSSSSAVMANFAVGDGFSDGLTSSSPGTSSVHSGFSITNESSMKFAAYNVYNTKIYNTALTQSSWMTLTWVINNTGDDLEYDNPNSGKTTVNNDCYDLWLGTTLVAHNIAATTAAKDLQNLYIGSPSGKSHEIRLDDISVVDLSPAGSGCYYVTYDGNGAEAGSISDATAYTSGTNVTVLGNVDSPAAFTKTGYRFNGWNTAANGSGTAYAAGATFAISGNVTLHAQWVLDACSAPSAPTISGTSVRTVGQTIELTAFCESGKDARTTYTWYKGETFAGAAQVQAAMTIEEGGRIFNKASCVAGDAGTYWCEASNGDGCEAHNATGFTVTVNDAAGDEHIYYYKDANHYSDGVYSDPEGNTASSGDNKSLSSPWMICNGCKAGVDSVVAYGATYDGKGNHMNAYIKLPTGGDATTKNIKFALTAGYTGTLTMKIGGYENNPTVTLQPLTAGVLGSAITPTSGTVGGVATTEDNFNAIEWPLATAGGTYVLTVTSKTGYISQIDMTTETSARFNVTYNGNGNTGGSVPTDDTDYTSGATVTVAANSGSLLKTNYTGAGWNTANNGTGTNYVPGSGTFTITANTTLYAHWTQLITLAPGTQGTGTNNAAVSWNGSVLRGFTAHTASGYALQGYYTEPSGGTKVLNADGSFAATDIDGFVTSGKWSNTGAAPTLYAQWEASNLLKWNLKVNVSETSITTLSKESAAPTVITVANMGNLTNNGSLTITGSAKSALTSKIATTASATGVDAGKYMSVQFIVAAGYQLVPSDIKVKVQPISHSQTTKLILEDNTQSISYTSGSLSKGSTQTVTMTNSEEVAFTGTVTLKIYVYGTEESDGYRLGTPIEINGSVEATCATPPTFDGLSYDATEYTVGASASAIEVTGDENVDTYLWKQNDVNDRSGGTAASGTNNAASYIPPTSTIGTKYYWCEMTNTTCGITIKTPAVGITVRNATTDPTVTWSDVKLNDATATPNYGGGNYVLRATVNEASWPGTLAASMITAPAGITIHHVTTGKADNKNYIEFKFDVTTAFDRASNATIDFNLALPEAGSYSELNSVKNVTYNDCSGGAAGQVAIKMGATASTSKSNPQNYWETAGAGRLMYNYGGNMGSTNNPSGYKTADSTFYYYAASTGQKWMFQTYIAGVNKVRVVFRAAGTIKSSKATITDFYYNTEYFASPGSNAVSFGEVSASKAGYSSGEDGYIEFTVPEMAANSYGAFVTGDGNMKVYGVVLYSENAGDGGSVPTNPAWPDSKADGFTVTKTQSDANFGYTISTTTNTLGAISYSSSNPSCAAVDPVTGEVTITATGASAQSAVITATLARSGCYQGATRTYTINVAGYSCSEPSGSIELTSGSATKCASESVTLTMTGFTEGADIQWYNGESTISNGGGYTITTTTTQSTLTTTAAGTYSAIATKSCAAKRTNSITVANMDMSEQKTVRKVSQWYVKNGRPTPDIALWQLGEGETFKSVAWSPTNGTGLDFVTRNGIVYLEGKEPSTNTSADIPYTLTLTITDACGTDHVLSGQTITIIHQKNTDKHVLAFVVGNTEKKNNKYVAIGKGFTESITASQTTQVSLYNAIAAQFDVQATNIYSTDDEQKLREYYSQYDILCITDYPNTQTKGANSKSYVDAIGALIDIRPILTMEAFVSALPNWKLKGVSGNPKSPSTRQYTMLLQCKDHEIFSGTKLTKVGEGDEAMYRVTMVDKSQEEYKTLDANYGDGEHKANEGYQYGKKPALQGFTYTEEMSDNDMLPLGLIDDGAGNDLQVGIERQAVMEARMMVLGINSYAMERLDKDGQTVVINALKYLMKKSAEDISDCSVYFDGSDETDPTNWDNELNWGPSYASLPLPHQEVRILKECVVKDGVVARASGIKIIPRGRINHNTDDASGSLTIEPGGALIVDGKVRAAVAPNYFNATPTTPANLAILTSADAQGALILDNSEGETQATVQMYSKATTSANTCWQYMGIPMESLSPAQNWFYNAWMMKYTTGTQTGDEALYSWEYIKTYDELNSFNGYALTQEEAKSYWLAGALAETGVRELPLSNAGGNGWNLYANSWTAPINIAAIESSDFVNADATIYLYNTGSRADWDIAGDDAISMETTAAVNTAGQYLSVPVGLAEYVGTATQIPTMQGFFVQGNHASAAGSLTLDYDKVVRTTPTEKMTTPLRAPRRAAASKTEPERLTMIVQGSSYGDVLHLFRSDEWTDAYDNGYDAHKVYGDDYTPQLAAGSPEEELAVVATDELEGTQIRFRAGTHDSEYTIRFLYNSEDESLYLYDIQEQTYTRVETGASYTFTASDKNVHTRFVLTRNAPQIATGVGEVPSDQVQGIKAKKLLIENKMFIMVNGMLYDATGKVVK